MNKRYIDFVPAKNSKGAGAKVTTEVRPRKVAVRSTVSARPSQTGVRRIVRPAVAGTKAASVARSASRVQSTSVAQPVSKVRSAQVKLVETPKAAEQDTLEKKPALGVIEDLSTKFVNTNVPKRPLSHGVVGAASAGGAASAAFAATVPTTTAAEAKAKKIKNKRVLKIGKPVDKPVENSVKTGTTGAANATATTTFKTPKSPFINQNKVVKRPLSKNVYQKKIEVPKEEPQGPVTIIAKPEKDKHVGIIVTIIITIILGATAGTVAFLLLPK